MTTSHILLIFIIIFGLVACERPSKKTPKPQPESPPASSKVTPLLSDSEHPEKRLNSILSSTPNKMNPDSDLLSMTRQCIESTCSKPQLLIPIRVKNTREKAKEEGEYHYILLSEEENTKLPNAINVYNQGPRKILVENLDRIEKNNIEAYTIFNDYLKTVDDNDVITLSSDYAKIVLAFQALSVAKKEGWIELLQKHYLEHNNLDIDLDSLPEIKSDSNKLKQFEMTKMFMTSSSAGSNFYVIKKFGPRSYLKKHYPEVPYSQAKSAFINDVKIKIDQLIARTGTLFEELKNGQVMKSFLAGEDIPQALWPVLSNNLVTIFSVQSYLNSPLPNGIDIHNEFVAKDIKEKIYAGLSVAFPNGFEDYLSQRKAETLAYCDPILPAFLATRPSLENIMDVVEDIETALRGSKKVAPQYFPNIDVQTLDKHIEGIAWNVAKPYETSLTKLIESLNSLKSNTAHSAFEEFQYYSGEKRKASLVAFSIMIDSALDKPSEFSMTNLYCEKVMPNYFGDSTPMGYNLVELSTRSHKSTRKNRIGVFSHEIGHRLDFEFSGNYRADIKTCLLDQHHKSDWHLIEDFADRFSSSVLKELNLSSKEEPASCKFFHDVKASNGKVVNTLFYEIHPLVSKTKAKHSSELFRLLNDSHRANSLSPECMNFIEKYNGVIIENGNGEEIKLPQLLMCEADQ